MVTAAPLLPFAPRSEEQDGEGGGDDARPPPDSLLNWSYRLAKGGGGGGGGPAGMSEMDGRRLLRLLARYDAERARCLHAGSP